MKLVYLILFSCEILLNLGCEAVDCSEYQGSSAMGTLQHNISPLTVGPEMWDNKDERLWGMTYLVK